VCHFVCSLDYKIIEFEQAAYRDDDEWLLIQFGYFSISWPEIPG
jgi:hypothetical protein